MKKLMSICMIILLIFSVSCKSEKQAKNQIKKENNMPKELVSMIDTVNNNELKIFEIKKETEKSSQIEVQKTKEEMIKKLEKEKNPKEGKVEDKLKSVETHEEKIEKMWTGLKKQIESSHTLANDYKVKAVEDKADEKILKKFEDDLNELTIFIESKDLLNSFISNNELYDDMSYFVSLYKNYRSHVIKLKYNLNLVYISGLKNEWDKASEGMNQVDNAYSEVLKEFNKELKEKEKPSDQDKKKEKNLEKLKLSIQSLNQSLNKEDMKLLEIKRSVVVTDIDKVKE